MPHYKFVVFTQPTAGREDEYNEWYSNTHLHDVLSADGFVAAQRFKLVNVDLNSQSPSPYMAIYEVEADDPNAALNQLPAAALSGAMVMSDALDSATAKTFLYQPITERISNA
jgi:hypothetical protein